MKNTTLICFGISLFLFSLNFSLVSACDESEMQTMMTGNVIGDGASNIISSNNLGILSLIKELLIIIVFILLVIFLIKQINKK